MDWPWTGTWLGVRSQPLWPLTLWRAFPGLWRTCGGQATSCSGHGAGADVFESWTFPEAANDGRFAVEVDEGSGFEGRFAVAVPEAPLPGGATAKRVAEIGADGCTGPWVSIGPGTP
jgi:hypothetical protein